MNLRIGDHVYVVTENDNLSKIKGFVVKRLALELDPMEDARATLCQALGIEDDDE